MIGALPERLMVAASTAAAPGRVLPAAAVHLRGEGPDIPMPDSPPLISQTFLLSPAYCAGRRAAILLSPTASFDLAVRLQQGSLTLGEAFAFMSGLYFRGKLAYAQQFARMPAGHDATLIITPSGGLRSPGSLVRVADIREFATVDVDPEDQRYRAPLDRDLTALVGSLSAGARVILLGSIATPKYVAPLIAALGPRLHYPPSFIGRGDMSRGGLLLRAARSGVELDYAPLDLSATRRGPRPPKLARESAR